MLNQQRCDAADAISDEIGDSCEVVGGFSEDAKERACENVRSEWPHGHGNDFVKGKVKGKGKGKTKGKPAADQKGTSR